MKTRRTVFLTLVAAIILAAAVFILQKQKIIVPSFQTVHDSYKKSEAVLLDRHGAVIHELRVDPGAVLEAEVPGAEDHVGVDQACVGAKERFRGGIVSASRSRSWG